MKAIQRSLRPGTRQALVSFGEDPGGHVRMFRSFSHKRFLPLGLLFWGATDETFVRQVRVGNLMEVDTGPHGRVPARYFETGRTFEEIQALASVGELEGELELRQVLKIDEAHVGNSIGVEVEGPFTAFCMWGLIRDGQPPQRARVTRQEKVGPLRPEEPPLVSWLGEVIESDLAGDRIAFEVEGPTPEVVTTLVTAFLKAPVQER